jgi:hypothetical protein
VPTVKLTTLRTLFVLIPLLSLPAFAGEEKEEESEAKAGVEKKEEAKGEEWEEVRHFFTGFGGVTIGSEEAAEGEPATTGVAPTFGLDYSYRVSKLFGIGGFFDYSFGNFHELLVGPALFIFPWQGLFVEISPSMRVDAKQELAFVARLAVGYEWDITPNFLLGLYVAADGAVSNGFKVGVVPGVTLGWGF